MKIIIFTAMKYIVRALKYFVFITLVMTVILLILALAGFVPKDINEMFRNGYDSLWQIGVMFLVVAAIYPRFGFCKRGARVPGDPEQNRAEVVRFMEERGYIVEKEDTESISFRKSSFFGRLTCLLFEDRITFENYLPGYYVEGRARDVARIISGLEYKFRTEE